MPNGLRPGHKNNVRGMQVYRCFNIRPVCLLFFLFFCVSCSSYQPTKNVWKSTKGLWNSYVSPPATIDFDEKGELSPKSLALANSMMGIDMELARLERTMQNADRPPTRVWLSKFFEAFPWINGFAGVKYDGTILGQEPANSMKQIDFIPLLYEDKKQNSHALRADVQNTPDGPEIVIAAPLYDGTDFLGIVAAYFDIRSLIHFSNAPEDLVILSPYALLWPGKYEFASTPLAGIDWQNAVSKSTSGTCSNANGTFFYMVRYLGNLPIIFAIVENGNFPEGNGSLDQGLPYFQSTREKLPPPTFANRKPDDGKAVPIFRESDDDQDHEGISQPQDAPAEHPEAAGSENEIQPGSKKSILLRKKDQRRPHVGERQLEGENISVERVKEIRQKKATVRDEKPLELIPDAKMPTLPGGRPSPFGPPGQHPMDKNVQDGSESANVDNEIATPDSEESPADKNKVRDVGTESEQNSDHPERESRPATLPGGRPSPFGPR